MPRQFHHILAGLEATGSSRMIQAFGNPGILQFGHITTDCADEKLTVVRMIRMAAADIGMQGFQFVNQALLLKKFQCPVHRGWRDSGLLCAQRIKYLVGAQGAITV